MAHFEVNLNTARNGLRGLEGDALMAEARRSAKLCAVRGAAVLPLSDADVPDNLVSDDAVRRYLEIEPPVAAVIPEFQAIVDEIEDAYVGGLYFAALSAACVSLERLLNLARIELHPFHPSEKTKRLWGKGPSNGWDVNIDALALWGYLDQAFADELKGVYEDIRNRYLHTGPIGDMKTDALRAIGAAYRLLKIFLGFPEDLFRFAAGIECLNPKDPRFKAFYEKRLVAD
jgi:hypothetical protein